MGKPKNRFDLQVVYPSGWVSGVKSRTDVEITPLDVARECEEFAQRIRTRLKRPENQGERSPSIG